MVGLQTEECIKRIFGVGKARYDIFYFKSLEYFNDTVRPGLWGFLGS